MVNNPEFQRVANEYDALIGVDTQEANLARARLIRQLPDQYQVVLSAPLKRVDHVSDNQSLSRQIFNAVMEIVPDGDLFVDDNTVGTDVVQDALYGIYGGLIGSIPAGFAVYYTINAMFPMLDADLGAGLMTATTSFVLGAIFACSTSAEIYKEYKKSLQRAGDDLNTGFGESIAFEEYSMFLDREYDERYEQEKQRILENAKVSFAENDRKILEMISVKEQMIDEFYQERELRKSKVPNLIDITPNQEDED